MEAIAGGIVAAAVSYIYVVGVKAVTEDEVIEKSVQENVSNEVVGDKKFPDRLTRIKSLFDAGETLTVSQIHSEIGDVTPRTIRRDLTRLEEDGFIKQIGMTRDSRYKRL